MATTKPALSGKSTPAVAPKIISDGNERQAIEQLIQRKVAERAYSLFEGSNAAHGKDQEHWLQAESEIFQRGLDIRESGSWLSITASLPNVSDDNLQICIEPNRAVVHGQTISQQRDATSGTQTHSQQDLFLRSDLNVEVDPSTASASMKDQKLTIMVKKRYPGGSPSNASGRTDE